MRSMIKEYLTLIKKDFPQVDNDELAFFKGGLTIIRLEAKSYYIEADKIQTNIGFVSKGLLRCFYIKEDGEDVTSGFVKEGDYVTHFPAFLKQEPSKYFFQCAEPTILINIPFEHMMTCFDKCPSLANYLSLSIGKEFANQLERIRGFLFEDTTTRYLKFVEKNQELFKRISTSHLSSYLGIEK